MCTENPPPGNGLERPDSIPFETFADRINETAKAALSRLLIILLSVVVCVVVVYAAPDKDWVLRAVEYTIPILNLKVKFDDFLFIAPFFLTALYFYFFFYTYKLSQRIDRLSQILPEGTAISDLVQGWSSVLNLFLLPAFGILFLCFKLLEMHHRQWILWSCMFLVIGLAVLIILATVKVFTKSNIWFTISTAVILILILGITVKNRGPLNLDWQNFSGVPKSVWSKTGKNGAILPPCDTKTAEWDGPPKNLRERDFTGARAYRTSFLATRLDGSDFTRAYLTETCFVGALAGEETVPAVVSSMVPQNLICPEANDSDAAKKSQIPSTAAPTDSEPIQKEEPLCVIPEPLEPQAYSITFDQATISSVNFQESFFVDASFKESLVFGPTNVQGSKWQGTRFVDLQRFEVDGVPGSWEQSYFQGVLPNAMNLTRFPLEYSHFKDVKSQDLNLTLGRLRGSRFQDVCFSEGVILTRADLSQTRIADSHFSAVLLRKTRFYHAQICHTTFVDSDFRGAILNSAIFSDSVVFKKGAKGVDMHKARMRGTVFHGTDLSGCVNLTLDQIKTACIDEHTKLPKNLEADKTKILNAQSGCPEHKGRNQKAKP